MQRLDIMKHFSLALLVLFGSNITAQTHQDGDSLWNVSTVHEIHLNFTQPSYWDTLEDGYTNDYYTVCQVVLNGRVMDDVGAKFKGNSSYNNPSDKKSFKIDFNEFDTTVSYDGIKKINLNNCFKDPTFMREKLALDFCRRQGILAPRCTYVRVFINSSYWGLYTLVEEVNAKFLTQRFNNNDGNLFKGDPSGDLRWLGSSPSLYYNKYELDRTQTNDWSDLVHAIDVINNTPSANFQDSLPTVFDTWSVLKAAAFSNIFSNLDSYTGSGHNYYIYHDEDADIFRWIVWDVNEAFGNFQMNMNANTIQTIPYNYLNQPANRPLLNYMFNNSVHHQDYINALCVMLSNDFSNDFIDPMIDSIANVIRPYVYADTHKFYTNQNFEDNITMAITLPGPNGGITMPGLKSFITARRNALMNQLSAFGCWLSVPDNSSNITTFNQAPNPANDYFNITPAGTDRYSYRVFNIQGQWVASQENVRGVTSVACSTWPNGIYFVEFITTSQRQSLKIIVTH